MEDEWNKNRSRKLFTRARKFFRKAELDDNVESLPGSYKKYCEARRKKSLTAQS